MKFFSQIVDCASFFHAIDNGVFHVNILLVHNIVVININVKAPSHILVRCLNWVYSGQTMIHDKIDQLTFYAPAIPHLRQVALLDTAGTSMEGMQVKFSQYITAPFGGTFIVHPTKVCVLLTFQGS